MVTQEDGAPATDWRRVEFLGNHPALDFANTISDRVNTADTVDRLGRFDDVAGWARAAGLIDAAMPDDGQVWADPARARRWLARARALREAGHGVFAALARGRAPDAGGLGLIAACVSDGWAGGALAARSDGPPRLTRARADGLIGLIAWWMLDAVFRLPPGRLGACPGCGWLYVDTTRGGRRRWCSMRDCGNREKARRHRARRKRDGAPRATE